MSLRGKPLCVAIQIKAIEQYFHVVLLIVLFKVSLNFESVDETPMCVHSNENYRAGLLCGTAYYVDQGQVVLTFTSVYKNLVCNHSKESCRADLSCGTVCYSVQGSSNF